MNMLSEVTGVKLPMMRKQQLESVMRHAETYGQWCDAARAHDELTGMEVWKRIDQTSSYDHVGIRSRLDRLRALRSRHDNHGLLFTLNEGIHGNMGGMGKAQVHARAKFGTKKLIEDYVDEIVDALQLIANLDTDEISFSDKLDFFDRASHCYGRSALMLSGGGALGFYHVGVVKALVEQDLLPSIISGASAGSLIAAVLGTHTDEELEKFFDTKHLRFEAEQEAGWFNRMFWSRESHIDVHDLTEVIERLVPDMTFEEAYKKTGRQISISIAPAELHQTSRLLNATASPNVYIRSAVMASCAVPGVYPAVTLQAKNVYGDRQPYLPYRKWIDGSISDDLPAKRLSRMYGVNHFIVSLINPLALPFVRNKPPTRLTRIASGLGRSAINELISAQRSMTKRYTRRMPRTNMLFNSINTLINQKYTGDITIIPSFRFYDARKLLSKLSEDELVELIREGEQATWPHIETIRTCTKISRTLDEILDTFQNLEVKAVREAQA